MRCWWSAIFAFLIVGAPLTLAAQQPPQFDLKKYQAVIAVAIAQGARTSYPGYEWRGLSRAVPNPQAANHTADDFNVIGALDSNHKFTLEEVSVVSENWSKLANGNWQTEQWMWDVSTEGVLWDVNHNILISNSAGQLLKVKSIPTKGASDPGEIAHLDSTLQDWYRWTSGTP